MAERKPEFHSRFKDLNEVQLALFTEERIDKGFKNLNGHILEKLKDANTFIQYRRTYIKDYVSENEIKNIITKNLRSEVEDALGPMAFGKRMSELIGISGDYNEDRLNKLLSLARVLVNNDSTIRPIIKKLSKIDTERLHPRINDPKFAELIDELISLQVNAVLCLITKEPIIMPGPGQKIEEEAMTEFISDVKEKIVDVNKLLETKKIDSITEQVPIETIPSNKMFGGNQNNNHHKYLKYKSKYLKLKSRFY